MSEDVIIVGAGIIGLSLGYELAKRKFSVRIIDARQPGREASWAGAGILPPPTEIGSSHPLENLRRISYRLHAEWANELTELTRIDNEYLRCGGLYLARSSGEVASLIAQKSIWDDEGVENELLTSDSFNEKFPELRSITDSTTFRSAVYLPEEAQIRNPRALQALVAGCKQLGVEFEFDNPVVEIRTDGRQVSGIETEQGVRTANQYCVTAGPWTYQLLKRAGQELSILPIRGQMLLFKLPMRLFEPIVNEGSRYVVPRKDGHVLVGSSEEEVGFDKSNSAEVIDDLQAFASSVHPELNLANRVRAWAGLRPAAFDGFPYIGRSATQNNLFVASAHFRSGLYLSTGTAHVLAQEMAGEKPEIDLQPFALARG